jgi:1,4-alpha-glucan branching enzyme
MRSLEHFQKKRRFLVSKKRAQTTAKKPAPVHYDVSLLTDDDLHLFNEGSHFRLYEKLGSQLFTREGIDGAYFAVWAPDAKEVYVIGDFNGWNKKSHPLRPKKQSGIWEGFIPEVGRGDNYKYHICSRFHGYRADKTDPFARLFEVPPKTASIVWDLAYTWSDGEWMANRGDSNRSDRPMSIYEMHLGSWRRLPEEQDRPLSYRELAPELADYMQKMNFTHVEFLPVMEHPFYGSWGYESLGFFAPTSRYGSPQDFMYLVDCLHQHGISVILDWVPAHFPSDEHGLGYFDGTYLFEHADPRQRIHPDWDSLVFNYGRKELQSFLISSALFWLKEYHADGLRVDAVASMLYLDYGRKEGEWIPNAYGGKENVEAIVFLRRFNEEIYKSQPDVQTIAEESTDWPMVSRPTYAGGLGFGMKWDMGWMHDTLSYMAKDPIHRKYHHNQLTFRLIYAYNENFVLPLSHDEVVHGKGSLIRQMSGDDWQRFANLRLLYGYMYGQPGKKLLFMGGEFGQWDEWYHEESLHWHLLEYPLHAALQRWVEDLNKLYKDERALHQLDFDPAGFEWVDSNDSQNSILSFMRQDRSKENPVLIVCNFTPIPRYNYRAGVASGGFWREVLNSDAREYGGSGQGNMGGVEASPIPFHGRPYSLNLTVPPLGAVFFKCKGNDK